MKYKIAMDKGVDVLSAEIKALKAKLEKAESVISFYANKRHWDYTRIQMVEDMEMHGFGNLGGLKAREYPRAISTLNPQTHSIVHPKSIVLLGCGWL